MTGQQDAKRALDRMVEELRAERAPELDWQGIEGRLLRAPKQARLDASPFAVFASRAWRPGLLAIAATGAAAVLALAHGHAPRSASVAAAGSAVAARPPSPPPSEPLNGDRLALGTRLTGGDHGLLVDHPGRARWTLEPHATAFVSDAGEFLTLQLVSGALSAAVVPNSKPETFAVEAGGTRVAVHGTAFRVERDAERVLVQVSEGTVAVEPVRTHGDPSFLLRRDSRGSFGLDGRTGSVAGNASVVMREAGGASHHEVAVRGAARAGAEPALQNVRGPSSIVKPSPNAAATPSAVAAIAPPLPLQPSISDIESGVSSAIDLLNMCFNRVSDKAAGQNRVSASTGMALSVAPDGSVQSVTFSPPLAPKIEDCAVLGLRNLTFAHSQEGVSFTRLLELSR